MKFGLSVPMGIFTRNYSGATEEYLRAFGSTGEFLDFCSREFDSVELRAVRPDCPADILVEAVRTLKARGLFVTIHGTLSDNFFAPYHALFSAGLQEEYTITVHPLPTHEETVEALSDICREIESQAYPVRIALENQRLKVHKLYGTCADVLRVAEEVNSKTLSLCFDFGHQLNNERDGKAPAPTDEFLTRVIHTHIHSLGTNTHFPLCEGECLLDRNLGSLFSRGYDGVLNLELSPERYCNICDVKDSLVKSAAILKAAAHQAAVRLSAKEFYEKEYEDRLRQAMDELDALDNCAVLIGPSAYAIKLCGVRIAVDVSPRILPISDSAKALLLERISEFDAHILTHGHGDHCDLEFISSLPSSVKKIIPDFIELKTDGRVTVRDGDVVEIGELALCFFSAAHFFMGKGVPEYGFAIKVDAAHYVFPIDARDYAFEYPHFDRVRAVFTHLWLGRDVALNFDELYVDEFCRFAKSFGAERIYTAHLVETSRKIDNMWSDIHLDLIKKQIPDIIAPAIGELIRLE